MCGFDNLVGFSAHFSAPLQTSAKGAAAAEARARARTADDCRLERDGRTYFFVDEESRQEFENQPTVK